jgi:valyl-tRNA synthetase
MLIRAPWPEKADYSAEQAVQFDSLRALVTEIRFVTNELPGTNTYPLLVRADDSHALANAELVMQLAKVQSVEGSDDPKGLRVAVADRDAWLAIDAKTLEEHQSNLEIRIASTHKVVAGLQARLATPSYVEKAPAHLVEETKRELEEKTALVERLQQELTSLAN